MLSSEGHFHKLVVYEKSFSKYEEKIPFIHSMRKKINFLPQKVGLETSSDSAPQGEIGFKSESISPLA